MAQGAVCEGMISGNGSLLLGEEAGSGFWDGGWPGVAGLVGDLVDEIVLSGWLGEAEFEHDPCSARSGGG